MFVLCTRCIIVVVFFLYVVLTIYYVCLLDHHSGIPYSGLFSWGANYRYFRGYPHVTKFRIINIYTLVISHKRVREFVATDTGLSNTFIDVVASRA